MKAKTIFILGVMSSDLLTYNSNKITQNKCFEWISGVILNDLMFLDLNCNPKSNHLCQKSVKILPNHTHS